ncbi:D-alanyl-D-alanine carboxypeptidase family protein [Alicyclobacillus pomorum]|uniref:D-alanyl-D-alanine carboxypeptidase family protein n=1 Tax=Alicyclobacillus pomorum TaxID=204470 RepID=UPI000416DE4B|nr:D-alanyl-D-alanine carboxypeptidase [Alicyclobacillus pomorum]
MKAKVVGIGIVVLVIVVGLVQLLRPLPNPQLTLQGAAESVVPGKAQFSFPGEGQSAVAVTGVGLMGATANQTPVPIASLTKMMTAYVVLKHHPLLEGEDGPTLTMTAEDEALYKKDKAAGDSVVKVVAGDKWTERQMLEGLMLPSGDNMAMTLAKWTAGSESAFIKEMNDTAKQLGMNNTTYADVSGVNPASRSTAVDQLKIADAAMQIPAFRDIVKEAQATLPGAGTVYNVDYFVGKNGIVGVKTGSTSQAGGCFVSAMYHNVGGKQVLMLGAVLGQHGGQPLMSALKANLTLLQEAGKYITTSSISKGTTVGSASVPWQSPVPLQTSEDATYIAFPGMTVTRKLVGNNLQVTAGEQKITVPLTQAEQLKKPSLKWRLMRLS